MEGHCPHLELTTRISETDLEAGWSMGFAWGFIGPAFSSDPPLVIAPELFDVFNEVVTEDEIAARFDAWLSDLDSLPTMTCYERRRH
jgi:hypothetical protein